MRFNIQISNYLIELVQQNEAELFLTSKKKDAHPVQTNVWNHVHRELINKYPASGIEVKYCKQKWKDLKAESKKDSQRQKRKKNATGGGPQPSNPSSIASQTIQNMFSDRPSFSGIPSGRETLLFKNEEENLDSKKVNSKLFTFIINFFKLPTIQASHFPTSTHRALMEYSQS